MPAYELIKPSLTDYDFLRDVHHKTLKQYVTSIWGWHEAIQDDFFKQDFDSGQIQIIRASGESIGYLHLSRENDTLYIVNILLLPEFQNRGLGSVILRDLIKDSKSKGLLLKLGVFKINTRAKSLYESLGFKVTRETETHFVMQL